MRGFKPWLRCQRFLLGLQAEGIFPGMADGVVELRPRKGFDFFYLHGNVLSGKDSRRENNLPLAVRPRVGATASVRSTYGPVFTLEDAFWRWDSAKEIVVPPPIKALSQHKMYWRCPNFRIGLQIDDVPLEAAGPVGPRRAVRNLRGNAS